MTHRIASAFILLVWLGFGAVEALGAEKRATNYDESKVPKYELPDPLLTADGRRVGDADTRLKNIVREFHLFDRAQADGVFDRGIVAIPSGHFLNWRRKIRKKVPVSVTLRRWRHMLDSAARSNGVVHLWSHPHNFITCPAQFDVFEEILKYAAQHIKNGAILNKTMEQYCTDLVADAPELGSPPR